MQSPHSPRAALASTTSPACTTADTLPATTSVVCPLVGVKFILVRGIFSPRRDNRVAQSHLAQGCDEGYRDTLLGDGRHRKKIICKLGTCTTDKSRSCITFTAATFTDQIPGEFTIVEVTNVTVAASQGVVVSRWSALLPYDHLRLSQLPTVPSRHLGSPTRLLPARLVLLASRKP